MAKNALKISDNPDEKPVSAPVPDLNKVIHERSRLAILSALTVNAKLSFTELKALLETTDGNLSVHARKLEEAGYLRCKKTFQGRTPRTEFSITKKGRTTLEEYLNHMERIINQVRKRA